MFGPARGAEVTAAALALSITSTSNVDAQWLEPGFDTALEVAGTVAGDTFGFWALPLGDVNGDQVGDFVVAAPLSGIGASAGGFVRALSGSDGTTLWTRSGSLVSGVLGYAIDVADWNGDGVRDVFAAAPFADGGRVFVHSGASGATLTTFGPGAVGDGFGASLALGDFDGDGVDDVAIGSIGYDVPGQANAGRVSVFSGVSSALIATIDGPGGLGAEAEFGTGLAFLGDVSQPPDGREELVVGHRLTDFFAGRALGYTFDGASVSSYFSIDGVGMDYGLRGDRIDGGLDVDGDGRGDFLVGDTSAELVQVFSGVDGALLRAFSDAGGAASFGAATLVPDLDGDALADVLIGARSHDVPAPNGGRVYLHSGASGALLRTMTWTTPDHRVGADARWIGDHDGDGTHDFLVTGTGGGTSGPPVGRVLVVRGPSDFPSYCDSTPNSTGHAATIAAMGSASVAANALVLRAGPLPESQPGLFFFGPAQVAFPFGDGIRCVGAAGGNVFRFPPSPAFDGLLEHAVDLTAAPAVGALVPGSTWHFQAWYRDPAAGGAGFNLSDGLTVVFAP